jgi:hypothetical protein
LILDALNKAAEPPRLVEEPCFPRIIRPGEVQYISGNWREMNRGVRCRPQPVEVAEQMLNTESATERCVESEGVKITGPEA